jgi:peptidoglycan/LPS O-acetylase OafA/YrhL
VLHQSYVGYISLAMMVVGYTWLALFYCCLILVAVTEQRGLVKFITRIAPLCYLGRISYSVYLLHIPISTMVFAWLSPGSRYIHTLSDALVLALAILAPIGLAALSWHLMERRLIRHGHTFAYRFGPNAGEPDLVVNGAT